MTANDTLTPATQSDRRWKMQRLQSFIHQHGIRMTCDRANSNPNMNSDPEWSRRASHWKCTIIGPNRRKLTTYFSQGAAHTSEPTAADVLDCLASDASGAENARSFEDWCSEYGYDTDSRKAKRTYKVIQRQSESLKRLLGPELYETLLWNTERQ